MKLEVVTFMAGAGVGLVLGRWLQYLMEDARTHADEHRYPYR